MSNSKIIRIKVRNEFHILLLKISFYTRSFGIFFSLYLQHIWQDKIDQSWISPIWPNFQMILAIQWALLFERIVIFAFFLLGSSFTSSDFVNGFENFSSNSFHFEMDSTIFEFRFFGFLTITTLNVPFCLKHVLLSMTHGLCRIIWFYFKKSKIPPWHHNSILQCIDGNHL